MTTRARTTPTTTVTVPPTIEPITVAEAKKWLRIIDDNEEDTDIERLISSARHLIETYTNRRLINTTATQTQERFAASTEATTLLFGPVSSITSIQYLDENGASQTWSTSSWQADYLSSPARFCPASGESYPTIGTDYLNPITITYVAGYGATASDVPADLRSAVAMLTAAMFQNERDGGVDGLTRLPPRVEALCGRFRMGY